jgi:hypothetical protein
MSEVKQIQLKISLLYIEPEIWRRVVVPNSFSLGQLHGVVQSAMGWQNCHLHRFEIDGVNYTFGDAAPEMNMKAEEPVPLRDVIKEEGQAFLYEYDFGDSWLHQVIVEKVRVAMPAEPVPVCLTGERACPPEDCGSYPGYEEILYALDAADPDEDQESLIEWLEDMCGDYDPEHFDCDQVNRQLERIK